MIQRVHEHLIGELNSNARTDTIFVIIAILLNLIVLAINSSFASSNNQFTNNIAMFSFAALLIVVNFVSEIGLIRGRQMRQKLIAGLLKMYKDQGVDGYYEASLIGDYRTRYNLFMLAVLFTGVVALVIPFILKAGNGL
jgi:hypothetical protein